MEVRYEIKETETEMTLAEFNNFVNVVEFCDRMIASDGINKGQYLIKEYNEAGKEISSYIFKY